MTCFRDRFRRIIELARTWAPAEHQDCALLTGAQSPKLGTSGFVVEAAMAEGVPPLSSTLDHELSFLWPLPSRQQALQETIAQQDMQLAELRALLTKEQQSSEALRKQLDEAKEACRNRDGQAWQRSRPKNLGCCLRNLHEVTILQKPCYLLYIKNMVS